MTAPTPEIDPAAAVIEAAKVWRIVRRDRQISGMTHHRACKALDEAVAALIGELDRAPVPPPTDAELEAGRESVRYWTARNEAARTAGASVSPAPTGQEQQQ